VTIVPRGIARRNPFGIDWRNRIGFRGWRCFLHNLFGRAEKRRRRASERYRARYDFDSLAPTILLDLRIFGLDLFETLPHLLGGIGPLWFPDLRQWDSNDGRRVSRRRYLLLSRICFGFVTEDGSFEVFFVFFDLDFDLVFTQYLMVGPFSFALDYLVLGEPAFFTLAVRREGFFVLFFMECEVQRQIWSGIM